MSDAARVALRWTAALLLGWQVLRLIEKDAELTGARRMADAIDAEATVR